jgi:hypothetical protein
MRTREAKCLYCGKNFVIPSKKPRQKYCCRQCWLDDPKKKQKIICEYCGKEVLKIPAAIKRAKHHYCSKQCCDLDKKGKEGNRIKNGIEYAHGYRKILVRPNKYEFEHRLIMEKHIGRKLSQDEVVHHINRNKLDNRIENLLLCTKAEHIELHRKEHLEHRRLNYLAKKEKRC